MLLQIQTISWMNCSIKKDMVWKKQMPRWIVIGKYSIGLTKQYPVGKGIVI
ncbi:hypothetical protein [Aquimarina aggregata]|uniref:hypothetical protein n=1 Tax=Aquimarina aggregata TaxID=1642818 RepID=UPI0024900438|nr:hypothetical protein [Aquimarina aggregata]